MLVTLLFSVLARKSRTLFSLPCPASEQVCRSREGAEPAASPSGATEIFHIIGITLSLQMGVSRGREGDWLFSFSGSF